jgi:hypothetical protein
LPLYNNAFLQAGDSSNIGTEVEAGLPNITGTVHGSYYNTSSGAFYGAYYSGKHDHYDSTSNASDGVYGFDASRSNSIYGKSDTVQPLAIRVSYCIQVFNAATELSTQESAQLASQMQMKAQTDLGNVTNPTQGFKNMAMAWGLPDYSAGVDIPISSINLSYTAPVDGFIIGQLDTGNVLPDLFINGYRVMYVSYYNGTIFLPVAKGDIMTTALENIALNDNIITFFPMKGADKESTIIDIL